MESDASPKKPQRVVFCTTPSIYSDIVLRELIRSPHLRLVGVVASTRILRKKGCSLWDALLLVRKTGLRYAAYLWRVTSLYTLLRRAVRNDPVRLHLRRNRVPVCKTKNINSAEAVAFVRSRTPDLLLSAHFNQLIGPDLLALLPQRCLNIHPGELPGYRGVDPVIHALARGERHVGVTLHLQDEEFDTGRILAVADLPVQPEDSLLSLNCRLFRAGADLLIGEMAAETGFSSGIPQEPGGRYDSWPTAETVSQMCKSGRRLAGFNSLA